MNVEKLQEETARLRLEVERFQLTWETFLRQGILFLAYQVLIALVLIYFFWHSFYAIVLVVFSAFLWKMGEGIKSLLELKAARKALRTWKETVNLANQTVE